MGNYISPNVEALVDKLIQRRFEKMGARVKVGPRVPSRQSRTSFVPAGSPAVVNVRRDGRGEYFELTYAKGWRPQIDVLDVRPGARHLLLQVTPEDGARSKFICGHDERAWFVAAVPEGAGNGASNVELALEALKPAEVVSQQARVALKKKDRQRRRNAAFVRQGEWFFIPAPNFVPGETDVRRNRPLRRSGGKPHMAEFAVESGGEIVFVSDDHPQGLSEPAYRRLVARQPKAAARFQAMRRNPGVFVRGRVRHADHATITLAGWHQVVMNTETKAAAMRHVAFLD
jgi:hypothetical protein